MMLGGALTDPKDYIFFSVALWVYFHIDLFLVDRDTLLQTMTRQISLITWSDHAPISMSFQISSSSVPNGIWRLNTSILHNPRYQEQIIKELIPFFKSNIGSVDSVQSLLSAHKAYMTGVFIKLGAREKQMRMQQIADLTEDIRNLESQKKAQFSPDRAEQLRDLQHQLSQLLISQHDLLLKRLKFNYYIAGNKKVHILRGKLKRKLRKIVSHIFLTRIMIE